MKYTIEGFSQEFALTLKKEVKVDGKVIVKKVDGIDLIILRWFVDFYPNMKKVEIDGEQYAWLEYSKLVEELPIIDISKRSFSDRLKKLVEFEVLTYQLLKDNGTSAVYGFGKNYLPLLAKNDRVLQKIAVGYCKKLQYKDSSTNNINVKEKNITSTNNNKSSTTSISYKEDNNLYSSNNNLYISNTNNSDPFVEFWESYPNTRRKVDKKRCETAFRLLTDEEKERAIKALELWKKTDDWKKNNGLYIPAPLVYLHQKRWDGILKETEQRQEKFESNIEAWKKLGLM